MEPHIDLFPNIKEIKVGTFPQSTPTTPKVLAFLTKKSDKSSAESPGKVLNSNMMEFWKKYGNVRAKKGQSEGKVKEKEKETGKVVVEALKGTKVELLKFGKQVKLPIYTNFNTVTEYHVIVTADRKDISFELPAPIQRYVYSIFNF